MADYENILKHWDVVAADYDTYGSLVMSRFCTRFPDYHRRFTNLRKVPRGELAVSPVITEAGVTKLRKMHELLKYKGDHISVSKYLAKYHAHYQIPIMGFRDMIDTLAEVMGEKGGLDLAVQQSLKKSMNKIWADFEMIYQELGLGRDAFY